MLIWPEFVTAGKVIPSNRDLDPGRLLAQVEAVARDAGRRIMEVYRTDFEITDKQDRSPLTAADLAAHRAIMAGLAELVPKLPVLSEESSEIPYEERCRWDRYWLVDPLDGTREFIHRNGQFTVNIALVSGHDTMAGVVYVPAQDLCFTAARGHGAHRRSGDSPPAPIHCRKTVPGSFTIAGSRSHGSDRQERFIRALGPDTRVIAMGSALKICLVADGQVDIYPRFGPTSEWDTAAAQCVVEEAGGQVLDLDLQPLRYNTKDSFLNPHFLVIADPSFDWRPYLDAP